MSALKDSAFATHCHEFAQSKGAAAVDLGRGLIDLNVWFMAVDSLADVQRDYLRLLLLTGLRKNEGSAIRRCDVDLAVGTLLIPDTKSKKPLHVHAFDRVCCVYDFPYFRGIGEERNDLLPLALPHGGDRWELLAPFALREGLQRRLSGLAGSGLIRAADAEMQRISEEIRTGKRR